jgi:hypothetical protein
MATAMRTILTAAGMEVVATGNDYAPHELLVVQRRVPSVWSARRNAAISRRYEGMQAAWNARHTAEREAWEAEQRASQAEGE